MSLLQHPNLNNDSDWNAADSVPDWRKDTSRTVSPVKFPPKWVGAVPSPSLLWGQQRKPVARWGFNQFLWMLVSNILTGKYIQTLLSLWNLCPPIHQVGFQLLISDPILCLSCEGQPMTKCCYFHPRPLAQQPSASIVLLWFLIGLLQVCVDTGTHTCLTDQGQILLLFQCSAITGLLALSKNTLWERHRGIAPPHVKAALNSGCLLLDKGQTLESTTKLLPLSLFLCLSQKRDPITHQLQAFPKQLPKKAKRKERPLSDSDICLGFQV